jgi:hypothetical protein
MRGLQQFCLFGGLVLAAAPLWAQVDNSGNLPPAPAPAVAEAESSDRSTPKMVPPPPVSGQSFPTALASEERSNYLRGGVAFNAAYTDNLLGSVSAKPVSDASYSIWPNLEIDETTPRTTLVTSYAPGFTFYQRTSSRNEQDQNAAINFQYGLSPHVTFSARDSFQKSSDVFNQPNPGLGTVSGGSQPANLSVIAPVADRLSNTGNVGLAYQFAANAMIGGSGNFSNLHYPDQAEVPGLVDSSSQSGLGFYSARVAREHYIGASYQYQRLLSYPAGGQNLTQTDAFLFFYSFVPSTRFSMSLFGGPQYASVGPQFAASSAAPLAASKSWNPAAGGSLNWQARRSSFAISYSHLVSGGGGLIGAVRLDSANASFRQQITKTLNASLTGGYSQNDLLAAASSAGGISQNGHTVSGTASLQQELGQHINLQLGYTRLHQDYSGVAVLAATPNTNREFASLSYQFSRPLGR